MSRTSEALKMLQYLSTGRQYSKVELVEKIHTNKRNIYELKKELQDAGYVFEDLPGRYGGYKLDYKELLALPKLSIEELKTLQDLYERMEADQNYVGSEDITEVLSKLLHNYDLLDGKKPLITHSRQSSKSSDELNHNYKLIKKAIESEMTIKCFYASMTSSKERHLIPYDLGAIDDEWYVVCLDFSDQLIKLFKVRRFESLELVEQGFFKDPTYRKEDYISKEGLICIGDNIRVKLRLTGPYAKTLKEKSFGSDVVIEDFGQFMIYQANLRGQYKIREFILKMGAYCEVLEPKSLKEEIACEYKKCLGIN